MLLLLQEKSLIFVFCKIEIKLVAVLAGMSILRNSIYWEFYYYHISYIVVAMSFNGLQINNSKVLIKRRIPLYSYELPWATN